MTHLLMYELLATSLGLLFLFLLIRENIWCWLFGGLSSIFSIILFYNTQLYSEAILYTYYVFIAIYGYRLWKQAERKNQELQISDRPIRYFFVLILFGIATALGLGKIFSSHTDADLPFMDAHTTIFSFIASYLEAHKILSGWIFWILINGVTIALYAYKGLYFYTGLMTIYFAFSVYGYISWKKKWIASAI